MDAERIGAAIKAAFGMSDSQFARMLAAGPGGGTDDLIKQLRDTPKNDWTKICEVHASERAEEACTVLKDGDLLYRDGEYLWVMYNQEIDDALKAIGCRRRAPYILAAGIAFVDAVEHVRCRRLGPPEKRDQIDPESLSYAQTLGDVMKLRGSS